AAIDHDDALPARSARRRAQAAGHAIEPCFPPLRLRAAFRAHTTKHGADTPPTRAALTLQDRALTPAHQFEEALRIPAAAPFHPTVGLENVGKRGVAGRRRGQAPPPPARRDARGKLRDRVYERATMERLARAGADDVRTDLAARGDDEHAL